MKKIQKLLRSTFSRLLSRVLKLDQYWMNPKHTYFMQTKADSCCHSVLATHRKIEDFP